MASKLNIYAQPFEHNPAYIVGNRAALEALHGLLGRALSTNAEFSQDAYFASDGEGYNLFVIQDEEMNFIPQYTSNIHETEEYPLESYPWVHIDYDMETGTYVYKKRSKK